MSRITHRIHHQKKEIAHRPVRSSARLLLLLLPVLSLSACVTQRVEKSDVRSSFKLDSSVWGSKGNKNGDDSDKLRSKFADSGWEKNAEGEMIAKNKDMYSGKDIGRGRNFDKKDAYLSKREAEKKYFKTPEYLERQEFATKSARDGKVSAREGAFDGNRAREAGQSARTDAKPGFLASLNPFKTSTAREAGDTFRTNQDRIGTRAQENSATATGVRQAQMGFYTDTVDTMDDVKRLLHPEAFD
ncbi:MAG: hypothetical protein KDN20_05455 [Verrucomicrobiae bacterium]|nr:hypothetical protein [Verrucomicrobiae bacterium]